MSLIQRATYVTSLGSTVKSTYFSWGLGGHLEWPVLMYSSKHVALSGVTTQPLTDRVPRKEGVNSSSSLRLKIIRLDAVKTTFTDTDSPSHAFARDQTELPSSVVSRRQRFGVPSPPRLNDRSPYMEAVVPQEITTELTQILANLVLGDNKIRSKYGPTHNVHLRLL